MGGLGFRPILCQLYIFAIHDGLCYGVTDGNDLTIKIDGVPFQADNLAPPQTVERS